jgi:putative peptidoglycan lipid II flippase
MPLARRTRATPAKGPDGAAGLRRASGVMALGTMASRATGFLRTVAIAAAIGTGALGDAYNVANTTPNILYDLLLGGVLTSVIVPVLVRASKEDADGGEAFASSLLTLVAVGLGTMAAISVAAAPLIIKIYLAAGGAEQDLAVTFLRWFLPQIVFYGIGATIGAILNVRRSFAAPMFAPVLNNLIMISICIVFVFLPGPRPASVGTITGTQTAVLAGGTTLGVIVMTLALLPSLRAVGFRYRPRLDIGDPRLRTATRLAGWTLLYVAVSQAGYLVVVRLSSGQTAYTVYTYAYQVFQLPYAVIGVSVITALLPRMSAHAAQGNAGAVRDDLAGGLRLTGVAIVPAALFLLALGQPVAVAVFEHGAVSHADALEIGDALSAFSVALVPFALFQVQLRAFYAHQDSRTPALVNIGVVATNIVAGVTLAALVPDGTRAVALALAFAIAYLVGVATMVALLRRRLGSLDGYRTVQLLTRVSVAAGVGAVTAAFTCWGVRAVAGSGWLGSALAVAVAGALGGGLFVSVGTRMGIAELTSLRRTVAALARRFGGRLGRSSRA